MKTRKRDVGTRGETGIGTLIVFIALILVAAIAAGVLLSTAGSLQQKAVTTGKQTEREVSSGLSVVTVSAEDGSDGNIEIIEVILKLSAGSDSLSLNDTIVTFDTKNTTQSLVYTEGNHSASYYNVTYIKQSQNYRAGRLNLGDIIKIRFNSSRSISESEDVRMRLVTKHGFITPINFITPDVISQARVILYP